jgi:hypothetical protein
MSDKHKSIKEVKTTRREVLKLGAAAGALWLCRPAGLSAFGQAGDSLAEVDHIMWGVRDLDEGIALIEEKSGVQAVIGGVHPNRGTRNALISLGERTYLEILAPDPAQPDARDERVARLKNLKQPEIFTWAAGTRDIEAVIKGVKAAGYKGDFGSGSREKPNGSMLKWRNGGVEGHDGDVVPFVIEWSEDSTHPATDSPKGCKLKKLHLEHPEHEKMNGFLEALGLQARVVQGPKPNITALIEGPKGDFELT